MAKRRRGRGTQLKSNQSIKSSSENIVLEDNSQKPCSRKVSKKNQSVSDSDDASLEEISSPITFQEAELGLTSTNFDGFTGPGPCKDSKLKRLNQVLQKEQTFFSRKNGSNLNTDVNSLTFLEENKEVKSCNDKSASTDKSQAKLFIKKEHSHLFENNEINLVGSKSKLDLIDSLRIIDTDNTNATLKSNTSALPLNAANDDSTDYKSLFEAVCKHIKIPTNISKNELFRTLNEKYLEGANSVENEANVGTDVPVKKAAIDTDIPSVLKVTPHVADIASEAGNVDVSESDGGNKSLPILETETDIESPIKVTEIKTEVVSVPRINFHFNTSELDESKSQSISAEKRISLKLPDEKNGEIIKKYLNNSFNESICKEEVVKDFSSCEKENGDIDVKLSTYSYQSEMEEIENNSPRTINEIDGRSHSEIKNEKIIVKDAVVNTAVLDTKKEKILFSEQKETSMMKINLIATDKCVLKVKDESDLPLECNAIKNVLSLSSENDTCEVQDSNCLKIMKENSLHDSKCEKVTSSNPLLSFPDRNLKFRSVNNNSTDYDNFLCNVNSPVEDHSVDEYSTVDTPKLINSSADVNCGAYKSSVSDNENFKTQSANIKNKMTTLESTHSNGCVDSNNIDVIAKTSVSPVNIFSSSLKPKCEYIMSPLKDGNTADNAKTISVGINDANAPCCTMNENNKIDNELNSIVHSKLKKPPCFTRNEINIMEEEINNFVGSKLKKNQSSTKNGSNGIVEENKNMAISKLTKDPCATKKESNNMEDEINILGDSKLIDAPSSTKEESNEMEVEIDPIVDDKFEKDMPLMNNHQSFDKLKPKDESDNHVGLSKKCTISAFCNKKSNEMKNLETGVADDAKDVSGDDADGDLNYSDFFVIDEVNDKFYLEVCDLEKDFIMPVKGKKVQPKSADNTKLERNNEKYEQNKSLTSGSIPGLSFIIGMKDDKKLNKAVYDCVLCNWDKNTTMMSGIEMKTHVKTRSHLMNLLRMLNYPLYERYNKKNTEWVTTSSLLETVLKTEATMTEQTIVAASKENYQLKKKNIIARINELKVIGNNVKIPQGSIAKIPPKNFEVVAKPSVDPQSFLQTSPTSLPALNSPQSLYSDAHSQRFPVNAPVCLEPALLKPIIAAPVCMQSAVTGPLIPIANNDPDVISTQPSIESKPLISAKLSRGNSKSLPLSVFEKSTLSYENINTQTINNATVSAPFIPASSKSVSPSVSSISIANQRKAADFGSIATVSAASIPAEILMPPPLSVSVLSKLKKASTSQKKTIITAPATPSSIPMPPKIAPVKLAAPILLPSLVPTEAPPNKPVVTPIKICDYEQVAVVSDGRYESFLKPLRNIPNVFILSRSDLKLEDLCDFITTNYFKVLDVQKRTLYLIVTGIHSITKVGPVNNCGVSNCTQPLEALNSLNDAKYCDDPARFAKIFAEKLVSVVNSVSSILPSNSEIGILPPLPISLISMSTSHKKLHEKKFMFPDYMIANRKASISSLYSFWMDSISNIACKSLSNFEKTIPLQLKNLAENRKLREMECSAKDKPSYNIWKQIVLNVVDIALPGNTNGASGLLKEDSENWKNTIDKLSVPKACNTINTDLSSDLTTKIAYDHLVFIGHSTSLELLPEIKFCSFSKWDFEEIAESQNLFLKMGSLNKMAIKKVLFIVISDIAMIGMKERSRECLVKKCEKTLTNIHTQQKKIAPSKIRASIYTPIDIISTEIKKFCIFESRVVVAPFTPRTYLFVPNMNAEMKFHSKMHDFFRFHSSVCFLKGSTKMNWDQTLKSFETEWEKLALEISQETMEHEKYVKQILTEIKTKDYKAITWKNLSVDSPVDTDSSLTIWKLYVEELATLAWVEINKNSTASELLPLFPSATGQQSQALLPIHDAKNQQTNMANNIKKKIIMPDFKNISLSGTSEIKEAGTSEVKEAERQEINRDHNDVIKFTKDILNAKRVKKIETKVAPIFNSVYIVRHVNQQVSQKELSNPFSESNFKSKMIFHNFSKYDESDLKWLLAKLGDYPAKSLCCLVFDVSIITTKLVQSSGCCSHSCNPVLLVNGLEIESSQNLQAFKEVDLLIDNQLKAINAFIQKLNNRISVVIFPLVPTKIYFDDESNIDHQTSHAIDNMGAYVVSGSKLLWKRALQSLIPSWKNVMKNHNREYDFYNYVPTYNALKANTFLFLENAIDFASKWTEPDIWKAFVEVFLLSIVSKKNSSTGSGIRFMSEKSLVSIKITGISSAVPFGFMEELFKSVDSNVAIEITKELYTVKNVILSRAVLLVKILNGRQLGDKTLSASLHDISGPVNTEVNLIQNLYITSIFENVYKSWKSQIITNLIKGIEGFDITTLKTMFCKKGFCCPGTKCCTSYHNLLDRRRNPLQVLYKQQLCNHPKELDGSCKNGDECLLSRNIFEQNFHPYNYQMKLCPSRASSEICNKRELCKYAHKDSPELLFTSDWQDLVMVGTENVFKFFAGAIRGSKKWLNSNNFKIIVVSSSAEFLELLSTVCEDLIKAFGLKVFMLGKNLSTPDGCDIIMGEPQAFVKLDSATLEAMNGAIIVDDAHNILGQQETALALDSLIRRVRQTSADYLTKVCLVVICATEKSYLSAGGAKYFSNALNSKLHEANSNTVDGTTFSPDIKIISSYEEEEISQPPTSKSSSKRKDYSRSRSRSREKILRLTSKSGSVSEMSKFNSTISSGIASSGSERRHRKSRSKSADKSLKYEHKSSSHSRRSRSRSRDRKIQAHSRIRGQKRRLQSRDRKRRSRSHSRDINKSSSQKRSKSSDKSQSKTRNNEDYNNRTQTSSTTASVSNKENTRSHSNSPVHAITNYSKSLGGSNSRSSELILQGKDIEASHQAPESCYQDRTASPSSKRSRASEVEKSSYPHHDSDSTTTHSTLNMETDIIYLLGTKLYEEYISTLEIQKTQFEKEFLVFRNVPELCPSYGHHYEAFSSMYSAQHGHKGEEHKERLWKIYWMSKIEEIKEEGWRSRQEALLKEYEKKACLPSINTTQEECKAMPVTSVSSIPFSTRPITQEKDLHAPSSSSYQVHEVGSDDSEDNHFDFENALTILEKLFDYIGFLGPALNAMVLKCKELGPTEEAFKVFTMSENVMVVNMVLEKVKTLKLSASGSLIDIYERAIETIPKLLIEAKNGPNPKVNKPSEDVPIDVIAIARVSMGKSSDFTLNLLKTALQYEGISNPSRELINDLYLSVCKMQFKLSSI